MCLKMEVLVLAMYAICCKVKILGQSHITVHENSNVCNAISLAEHLGYRDNPAHHMHTYFLDKTTADTYVACSGVGQLTVLSM